MTEAEHREQERPLLSEVLQFVNCHGGVIVTRIHPNHTMIHQNIEVLMPTKDEDRRQLQKRYYKSKLVARVIQALGYSSRAVGMQHGRSIQVFAADRRLDGSPVEVRFHVTALDMRAGLWPDHSKVMLPSWSEVERHLHSRDKPGSRIVMRTLNGQAVLTYNAEQ